MTQIFSDFLNNSCVRRLRSAAFVMPPPNTAGFVIRQCDNVAITNCQMFRSALQLSEAISRK